MGRGFYDRSQGCATLVGDGGSADIPRIRRAVGFLGGGGRRRQHQGDLRFERDNRDNATDSRLSAANGGVGYVPLANILGELKSVYRSPDSSRIGMAIE